MHTKQNPSPAYLAGIADCLRLHTTKSGKVFTGLRTFKSYHTLETIAQYHRPRTALDYGCGNGGQMAARDVEVPIWNDDLGGYTSKVIPSLKVALGLNDYTGYDPAHPDFRREIKGKYGIVICIDTLDYIPRPDRAWVYDELLNHCDDGGVIMMTVAVRDGRTDKKAARESATMPVEWQRLVDAGKNGNRTVYVRCHGDGIKCVMIRKPYGTWTYVQRPQLMLQDLK